MKTNYYINALIVLQTFLLTSCLKSGRKAEVSRIDLQQHDLSIPGHELIQKMIVFGPGSSFGKHYHPGEEIIYVAEGSIQYQLENKPPVIVKQGEVLFIPAGTSHSARNITDKKAKELATYIVPKGKPLLTFSD